MTTKVCLNVGGLKFEVERSLIENYSDTMLARLISSRWNQNPEEGSEIFIGRNGRRFEFVLDYMRDRKIQLPSSVPKQAILQELQYFGFENIPDNAIIIAYSGYEAGQQMTWYQEAHIRRLEELRASQKHILLSIEYEIVAIECYNKFCLAGRHKINFNSGERGYENFFKYDFDQQVFDQCLEKYGLRYAGIDDCRRQAFYFSIVLEPTRGIEEEGIDRSL